MTTIDLIRKAFVEEKNLLFDYVSKDKNISYHRLVVPSDLKLVGKEQTLKLYGTDIHKGVMRCFDIEGIMKVQIINRAKGGERI